MRILIINYVLVTMNYTVRFKYNYANNTLCNKTNPQIERGTLKPLSGNTRTY